MMPVERPARVEQLIRDAAQAAVYPATPDLRSGVRARLAQARNGRPATAWRWAYAFAALLVVAVILGGVPQVRAGVGEWLRVGAVRILLRAPGPATAVQTPITPAPLPDLVTWQQLGGATTLAEASEAVPFDLLLPTYPADLGKPDRVFVQELGAPSVILIWPADDGTTVELALFEMGANAIVHKVEPRTLQEVTVRGQRGVWATGPYLVVMGSG
ncbi:MAG: hypothetical protein IT329_10705, partial [Caldilineaceae bacterium]|nr:hypothetical protein [Caldilineaceae bacterium]